ncbi:hypothetical protein [Haloglomus litoreum]|uniref:hypothetical protein n=1 Tax=Haloglomus litoreum TaxID=3034026 RepID=UPI0023E89560|nr:hypothetical protein [Haloglomus sp. DT116]
MSDDADALDREALESLHEHLAATAERPVERTASRWLGEAEAVAADARHIEDPAVARERLGEVVDLLSNVEGTGDETADEHVRAAKQLAAELTE